MPQQFVWQVLLPSLFRVCLEMFIVKPRAFGCNLDSNDFDWQFDFFPTEAFMNLCGNMKNV